MASANYPGWDETVRLWDVQTGKQLHVLEGHWGPDHRALDRCALAFSPDGRMLASSGADKTVRLWDVGTGKELRHWSEPGMSFALAFSSDGKVLAAEGGGAQTICFLNVGSGEVRRIQLRDCPGSPRALQFSPDGKTLVSGNCADHVAPDGKTIIGDGYVGTVHWWDTATGKELRRVDGILVAASADGKWLAIRQKADILLWDMSAGKGTRRLPLEDAFPADPGQDQLVGSFTGDGKSLVVPDGGKIRILDTQTGTERPATPGHTDEAVFVDFSRDGRRLISAGDTSIRLWDPRSGKQLDLLRGPAASICAASMDADGRVLAAGTRGAAVHVWDLERGKELCHAALDPPYHACPAVAPDGKTLAVHSLIGGNSRVRGIQLLDAASGKVLRQLGKLSAGCDVAFLPHGLTVAACCSDTLLFLDPLSGKEIGTLVDPGAGSRRGLMLSTDGRIAAASCPDRENSRVGPMNTVGLWEVASGNFIGQSRAHDGMVCAFTFARSGRVVASGGWDGTVRLWDLPSGRELGKFEGHRGGVLSLAFSPDDKLLASGGSDTTILVWDVAEFTGKGPLPEAHLSGAELEKLWTALGADSAQVGYRALWQLAAGAKPAVDFLKEALGSKPPPEETVKKLIADLDAEQFEVRERATEQLSDLGRMAQPLLQKALDGKPSAEMRRRLEKLVTKLLNPAPGRTPEELRQIRAVQALEYGGSSEARQLLQSLAEKEPETALSLAAKAARKRLARQRP
jgi:WD40 repeat protein